MKGGNQIQRPSFHIFSMEAAQMKMVTVTPGTKWRDTKRTPACLKRCGFLVPDLLKAAEWQYSWNYNMKSLCMDITVTLKLFHLC